MIVETTRPGDLHRTFIKANPPRTSFCQWLFGPQKSHTVSFITSRKEKFQEVEKLLSNLSLVQRNFDLPTLEKTEDLGLIAAYRVLKAFKKTQEPTILEETGLYVDTEKGYPGRFFKDVVERTKSKQSFAARFENEPATFRTAFAYTEDGRMAHIFSHQVSGKIVNPKDWQEADGSDPLFQMNGYNVPMSHLSQYKHFLYARQFPCAELRTMIEKKTYAGVYELHVTVANAPEGRNPLSPTSEYAAKFSEACQDLGVKALHIQMDNPAKPDQLQTAIYVSCPDGLKEASARINALAKDLLTRGFPILRNRIEAMLHNREAPKTDNEALDAPRGNYFEFHARLDAVLQNQRQTFEKILHNHKTDQFKVVFSTVGGQSRYFVNVKAYKVGSQTALIRWEKLLSALVAAGFTIAKRVKPEYCVLDEKPKLDYELVEEKKE